MNEQDRDTVIKEARVNALHDVQMALAKLLDTLPPDSDARAVVNLIFQQINLRVSEVSEDKADRIRVTHRVWEDE